MSAAPNAGMPRRGRHWLSLLLLLTAASSLLLLPGRAAASGTALYMIMEYGTDGTVLLNQANISLHTVSMNVTLLGCDFGYYDHYLLNPPAVKTPKMLITPFDCRECVCSDFERERAEDFVSATGSALLLPP
jgi:hypothetical protein